MIELRPVGYILGLLIAFLGAAMLVPMVADIASGSRHWAIFLEASLITMLAGGLMALASANAAGVGLTLQQSFLLATATWTVLPAFGAIPFMLGVPGADFTDAFFEAMSGMTTTGSTVFVGLDDMPRGTLLWRSILQWAGGLGIIIVALIFLPVMKVGGMQYFRSEGFDTLGKILPRALDISTALVQVYIGLTVICVIAYAATGMSGFDALNHALTTIATGGYSTSDQSFAKFPAPTQYVGVVFMFLAGLPFIRFVQLMRGDAAPLWRDIQVRAYLRWTLMAVGVMALHRVFAGAAAPGQAVQESLFNVVSLFSGTGYGSADVGAWGAFPLVLVIAVGFVGACTASTGCSIKVFRYLVLIEAVKAQIWRILSPNRVSPVRLEGRSLGEDVINSVIVLFTLFVATFGLLAVALSLAGLETRTAITAAWTSVCNIGPAFGAGVGPTGAMDAFPDAAKWLMALAMLLGRLEILSVLVILMPRFWRA
ncbi:potassium transporter TrkH [Rhodobacteraceae bacterium WD3A24]|nr:potassium transporter TrkH [Rhodobacteraceae bacterium WD3A24]